MIPPAIALGIFFLASLLAAAAFWPRRGLWWRWREASGRAEKTLVEDVLKHLYHAEYSGSAGTVDSLAGAVQITRDRAAELLLVCQRMGLLSLEGDRPTLTATGRTQALHVIRVHRLWECYLAERTGLSSLDWHREAERREHTLTPSEIEALDAGLNHPSHDPHGDPIPTADGAMPPPVGVPLTELAPGAAAAIVHVEDEPEAVYRRLVELELRPGSQLRVLEHQHGRIRFLAEGNEVELPSLVAANLTVKAVSEAESESWTSPGPTLTGVAPGQGARVVRLAPSCRGMERARLLDLGIVPGTWIEAQFRGPLGDPVVYRIRGASIALRREQADKVLVEPPARSEAS